MIFRLDDTNLNFPDPELSEEDGLLAVGGDLSPERLMLAYSKGIFPWYSEETPILWYSPHERFVLFPDKVKVSKSMKAVMRNDFFRITFNADFANVIKSCAAIGRKDQPGTWITPEMQEAYINLNKLGHAHSVEIWKDNELVGGLYGVEVNNVFCGESMFSTLSNASKAALIWLCKNKNYRMIDCQIYSEHLESMGAEMVSRDKFLRVLNAK